MVTAWMKKHPPWPLGVKVRWHDVVIFGQIYLTNMSHDLHLLITKRQKKHNLQ